MKTPPKTRSIVAVVLLGFFAVGAAWSWSNVERKSAEDYAAYKVAAAVLSSPATNCPARLAAVKSYSPQVGVGYLLHAVLMDLAYTQTLTSGGFCLSREQHASWRDKLKATAESSWPGRYGEFLLWGLPWKGSLSESLTLSAFDRCFNDAVRARDRAKVFGCSESTKAFL